MIEAIRGYLWRRRSVQLPHWKDAAELPTADMPLPAAGERVVLPMLQHKGTPCDPTVRPGDGVARGQVVGDGGGTLSAPIHSSVSGVVLAVEPVTLPDGQTVPAVIIESDGEGRLYGGIAPPVAETRADFLRAVRASGLVGLGGGGLPAHVKLDVRPGQIDALLLNGAECEPYLTADYRACVEDTEDLLRGARLVMDRLEIGLTVIGIAKDKPLALALLRDRADGFCEPGRRILVKALPARYPQGAEKALVYGCLGRRVPAGGVPADAGCLVMNVSSAAFLWRYWQTGHPLTDRRLTVDGTAVRDPANVRVALGTPLTAVLRFCGVEEDDLDKLLSGGPMMGRALPDAGAPVLKQTGGVTALAGWRALPREPAACIRCGGCVAVCPMLLEPVTLERDSLREDAAALRRHAADACIACGCCDYVCPARRRLTEHIQAGKRLLEL